MRIFRPLDKFLELSDFFQDYVKQSKTDWSHIIIHHSATKDGQTFDSTAIRKYHIETNKWQEIGYHFLIEQIDGQYYYVLGRPLIMNGAHSGTLVSNFFNKHGIGICCVGNFDVIKPPIDMLNKLRLLVIALQEKFNISKDNVIGHWEVFLRLGLVFTKEAAWSKYKTCPGRLFDLDSFRSSIKI